MCVRARDSASQHSTVQLLLHATLFTNLTCTFSQKVGHSCSWNCRSSGFCCSQGHTTDFPQILYCSPCKKIQSVATPTLRALPTHRLLYVGLWLIVGKRVRRMRGRKLLTNGNIDAIYLHCLSLSELHFVFVCSKFKDLWPNPLHFSFVATDKGHWNPKLLWVYGSLACCDDGIHALSGVYVCVIVCDGSGWDTSPITSHPYQSDAREQDCSYFWKIPRSPRYWMEFSVDKIKWLRKSFDHISLSFFFLVELQLHSPSNEWHESESLTNVRHSLELGVKA